MGCSVGRAWSPVPKRRLFHRGWRWKEYETRESADASAVEAGTRVGGRECIRPASCALPYATFRRRVAQVFGREVPAEISARQVLLSFGPSGLRFGALSRFQPHPQFGRLFPVADQAKSADVGEVALAAAFDDGNDVVGIPQRFSIDASETPARKQLVAVCSS